MESWLRNVIQIRLFLRYLFWKFILKVQGGSLGKGVKIYDGVRLLGSRKNPLRIGSDVSLMQGAILSAAREGRIEVGSGSYIGEYCVIMSQGGIAMGKKVMMAPHCVIVDYAHRAEETDRPMIDQGTETEPVVIGDDVWLGASAKVLKGVRIGEGSIIGAGSVVTKEIPPYSVAVGIPARVIKRRREAAHEFA